MFSSLCRKDAPKLTLKSVRSEAQYTGFLKFHINSNIFSLYVYYKWEKHLQNADNIVVNHKSSPLKKLNNLVFSDEVIN